MDVTINATLAGRFIFKLYTNVCPKACENFKALCVGGKEIEADGVVLHYIYTQFHRIVPNGWIQGGDIFHGRGNAGRSIYGEYFEDECFLIKHNKRGILGMANKGRHTNGSQFYITLQPTSWMDEKYVAFGVLVEGSELLTKLEAVPTKNERPIYDCRIQECGVYLPDT